MTRLHSTLAGYVTRGQVPGLVALVARGENVEVEVLGAAARNSLFRISSMTKPITAAAAMILVEEGQIRLDEPVDRLLPELANRRVLKRLDAPLDQTVPATRPIAVRDLLTFTLGTGLIFAPPGTYPIQEKLEALRLGQGPTMPQTPPAPDEWMRRLGTLPLLYQPGERWTYNTGADVLGVLIARAAKKPFATFLGERIFEPLGMVDTDFSVPANKRSRLLTSYGPPSKSGGVQIYDAPEGQWSHPPPFPSGAAGLVSTADDYLAFARMLLGGGQRGKVRILSPASVAQMTRDQLTPAQKARSPDMPGFFDTHGWGFCMAVVTGHDDSGSIGAFGWDGGLGTTFRADPKEQMVHLLMTQRMWSSPEPPAVAHAFWRLTHEGRH